MNKKMTSSELEYMIGKIVDKPLVGSYIVIAESFESDGSRVLVVKASDKLSSHAELGMLNSAMNRAKLMDEHGWQCDGECNSDEDHEDYE